MNEVNENGGINGRKINVVVEDAPALDVKKNILAFNKLVDVDGVVAVIGPSWDDAGAALGPLADRLKIPVIGPDLSQGVEKNSSYDYLFSLWYPQATEADKLMNFAASRGVKKLDILRNIDPFSQQEFEVIKVAAAKNNIDLASDIKVIDPDAKEFRTEIAKLKADNVDAVFLVFQSPATKCPALKQLKELSFKKLVMGESSTETASCREVLEGTFYSFPKSTKKAEELLSRFREKYHTEPKTPAVPNAYDATTMVINAFRAGNFSGDSIQKFLINVNNFDGAVASSISFDDRGHLKLSSEDFFVKTIRDGKIETIE